MCGLINRPRMKSVSTLTSHGRKSEMTNEIWAPAVRRRAWAGTAISAAVAATMLVAGGSAVAEPRAKPFDAWPEPQIQEKMTVDEAKALVAERTKPQTDWKGPTSGPKSPTDDATIV